VSGIIADMTTVQTRITDRSIVNPQLRTTSAENKPCKIDMKLTLYQCFRYPYAFNYSVTTDNENNSHYEYGHLQLFTMETIFDENYLALRYQEARLLSANCHERSILIGDHETDPRHYQDTHKAINQ
jgi:hypothetical protein